VRSGGLAGHSHFAWFQRHDLSLRRFLARPGISGDCGYIWVDCFITKEGQEWLKTHKPITEPTAP
jgi:hypothetical protein